MSPPRLPPRASPGVGSRPDSTPTSVQHHPRPQTAHPAEATGVPSTPPLPPVWLCCSLELNTEPGHPAATSPETPGCSGRPRNTPARQRRDSFRCPGQGGVPDGLSRNRPRGWLSSVPAAKAGGSCPLSPSHLSGSCHRTLAGLARTKSAPTPPGGPAHRGHGVTMAQPQTPSPSRNRMQTAPGHCPTLSPRKASFLHPGCEFRVTTTEVTEARAGHSAPAGQQRT